MHCRPSCFSACSLLRTVKGGYFEADRPMLEAAAHSGLAAHKRSCARVVKRSCRGPRVRLRDQSACACRLRSDTPRPHAGAAARACAPGGTRRAACCS